eukprot:1132349-Rhodomonas_salina.2
MCACARAATQRKLRATTATESAQPQAAVTPPSSNDTTLQQQHPNSPESEHGLGWDLVMVSGGAEARAAAEDGAEPVSYTHLTLPTICSV